jgi:hypothetical protein
VCCEFLSGGAGLCVVSFCHLYNWGCRFVCCEFLSCIQLCFIVHTFVYVCIHLCFVCIDVCMYVQSEIPYLRLWSQ